jgi:hypothetical protein
MRTRHLIALQTARLSVNVDTERTDAPVYLMLVSRPATLSVDMTLQQAIELRGALNAAIADAHQPEVTA